MHHETDKDISDTEYPDAVTELSLSCDILKLSERTNRQNRKEGYRWKF